MGSSASGLRREVGAPGTQDRCWGGESEKGCQSTHEEKRGMVKSEPAQAKVKRTPAKLASAGIDVRS